MWLLEVDREMFTFQTNEFSKILKEVTVIHQYSFVNKYERARGGHGSMYTQSILFKCFGVLFALSWRITGSHKHRRIKLLLFLRKVACLAMAPVHCLGVCYLLVKSFTVSLFCVAPASISLQMGLFPIFLKRSRYWNLPITFIFCDAQQDLSLSLQPYENIS